MLKSIRNGLVLFFLLSTTILIGQTNHSIAREWNELLLESIRKDFARPTVHARNLFHSSIAMYDAWAVYDDYATTYLLGKELDGFTCYFTDFTPTKSVSEAREESISYAAYRLLNHRFNNAATNISSQYTAKMVALGYDVSFTSTDYSTGDARALGNYIADCIIEFGLQDGSNEQGSYANQYYTHSNGVLIPASPGNPSLTNPNLWQPLSLETFIDQSGNVLPKNTPEFLSPEWGNVTPFSLTDADYSVHNKNGHSYKVYLDPGTPPLLDVDSLRSDYEWGFSLVSLWSSHLDHTDGVMWDISPAAMGNIQTYPEAYADYMSLYDTYNGSDGSTGYTVNPTTGLSYESQLVPRGDYTRVLAEFWADGPDSETPPGHWFTILNYVSDHDLLEKKYKGEGSVLSDLEWDVKAYFSLGGAVHDAAIAAWSLKGYYDYIRPISAIRHLSDLGQSSDINLSNYNANGIALRAGYIELVSATDPLVGAGNKHLNKIKVKAWKGPDYITDPSTDVAGVDWILAEDWWPYQRPSFVTPPFSGFVSGHSVFSRAAAEVLTLLTGDAYFPGGMGEFVAKKDEFLVFEKGPSQDVTLQWATYRDASDQTSLSRIWGGIHPPADDLPGRKIGDKIGVQAFELAESYFGGESGFGVGLPQDISVFPNPSNGHFSILIDQAASIEKIELYNTLGQSVYERDINSYIPKLDLEFQELESGVYFLYLNGDEKVFEQIIIE